MWSNKSKMTFLYKDFDISWFNSTYCSFDLCISSEQAYFFFRQMPLHCQHYKTRWTATYHLRQICYRSTEQEKGLILPKWKPRQWWILIKCSTYTMKGKNIKTDPPYLFFALWKINSFSKCTEFFMYFFLFEPFSKGVVLTCIVPIFFYTNTIIIIAITLN